MPTDVTSNGNRLLTLITKMQFEEKYNMADYLFQANSVFYNSDYWCKYENRSLYWVQVSIHHYKDESCSDSTKLRFGDLVIEFFDEINIRKSSEIMQGNIFSTIEKFDLVHRDKDLSLNLVMNSAPPKLSNFELEIPIKYNNRIKFQSKDLNIISEKDETGLTELNFTSINPLIAYTVEIYYDPPIIIKLIAFKMYVLLLLIFFQIIYGLNRGDLVSSQSARRNLNS
jgi:hypothetical protein